MDLQVQISTDYIMKIKSIMYNVQD